MDSIYFFVCCVGIAGIIFWAYRNDDFEEFNDSKEKKKFSIQKKKTEPSVDHDDNDTPQANLL